MKKIIYLLLTLSTTAALAKLPAPSDEAKAKAAETAAKTAYGTKLEAYQLCKAQDRLAAKVNKSKAKTATAPCADPGKFIYPPPVASAAPQAAAPALKK